MKSRLCLFAVLLVLLVPTSGETSQLVVIQSSNDQILAGQLVDGAKPLSLPAGVEITLVGEDGKMTRLKGPFSGPPLPSAAADGDPKVVAALSRLFVAGGPGTTSLGVFRGYGATADAQGGNPPDVWAVNVYRSESLCVPEGSTPTLWRPDPGRDLSLIVLHLSTGKEGIVGFPATVHQQPWPAGVPLLDGGEYSLRDGANMWERKLVLKVVPNGLPSEAHGVAWMADNGCLRQAQARLESLAAR
ncbi:MAG: hypothetical protein ACFCUO_05015 [Rhodospirillales bacterium]